MTQRILAILAEISVSKIILNELAETRADLLASLFPAVPLTRFHEKACS